MPFEKLRTRPLPAMQVEVEEYEHGATGARHIHLASEEAELVFLAAFPTLPEAGDGRAHILEHISLCGSQRYPVRDPFFSMLRRSTAHFMNAMTYPDRTVYPFATTDRTDFFNLLNVYLDAAFFPRLEYLDFLQEGWRLALDGEKLAYHGVVFNEMKGAFSSPQRAIDHGIQAELFKGTTYAVESGGDPLDIPSLTHAQLQAFHAEHYHPSQTVFMSSGRIDAREIQQVIEERVLAGRSGRMPLKLPQLAATWDAPRSVSLDAPANEHSVQIAWLMGETADPLAYYRGQLLEDGLLGNAAAPLLNAMESAGYGRPSMLNGIDPTRRQLAFHLGMEGLTDKQTGKARKRIWDALEKTAQKGVPRAALLAALRDLRFSLKDVRDGHTPNALSRMLRALPHAFYGGDIMNGFEADAVLDQLRDQTADPAFFKGLVQELLDATTRLDAVVRPDPDYFGERQRIEEQRLVALQGTLTEAEKQRIRDEAQALQERQRLPADNSVLPRIRPADVNPEPRPLAPFPAPLPTAYGRAVMAQIPSNGISYARVMYDVSDFEEAAWPWLQLYVDVLPELGLGEMSYDEADAWRHEAVPSFHVDLYVLPRMETTDAAGIHVGFSARGLREEHEGIAAILSRSITEPRFDEHARLAYLIDSNVQDTRNALADEGDQYARLAACAPLTRAGSIDECVSGPRSLSFLTELHARSQTADGIAQIAQELEALHRRITSIEPDVLCAGIEQDANTLAQALVLPRPQAPTPIVSTDPASGTTQAAFAAVALHAPAQVNHCYAAWRVPSLDHPDAPALSVLAELLTNLVLHQALREEGGAYGGQAFYSPAASLFVMMSYRDPRLDATYAEFERALAWIAQAEPSQESLEEAIVCVIQSVDRPRPPYAELQRVWSFHQQGGTQEMRRRYRQGVLACTVEQARAAAARWLKDQPCSRAAFVGHAERDLAGLELVDLVRLAAAPAAA